jgi:hypothetical protein
MPTEDGETVRARLRETGQMDAFLALKRQYVAEGMSKRKAWQQAASQFPPSELPPPADSGDVTLEDFAGKSSSFPKDVAWVYSHLCRRHA